MHSLVEETIIDETSEWSNASQHSTSFSKSFHFFHSSRGWKSELSCEWSYRAAEWRNLMKRIESNDWMKAVAATGKPSLH